MKIKELPVFTFKQENGKWHSMLNPKFVFHMETVKGIPHEMFVKIANEKFKEMPRLDLELLKIKCWDIFVKENNIDITPYQKENKEKKEEIMAIINEQILK